MSRAFSEQEKLEIESELLLVGSQHFKEYGFKKTNIKAITDEVGIAKGSFYNFYKSKEELFLTIVESIEQKFQKKIILELKNQKKTNKACFKYIMREFCDEIENNNILKSLFSLDNIQSIWNNIPQQKINNNIDIDIEFFEECYQLISKDKKINITSEVFVGMARSICFMVSLKDLIGENIYQEVIKNMIDSVADKFL